MLNDSYVLVQYPTGGVGMSKPYLFRARPGVEVGAVLYDEANASEVKVCKVLKRPRTFKGKVPRRLADWAPSRSHRVRRVRQHHDGYITATDEQIEEALERSGTRAAQGAARRSRYRRRFGEVDRRFKSFTQDAAERLALGA